MALNPSDSLTQLSSVKIFGGQQLRYSHFSESCQCQMTFSLFLPPQAEADKVPLLIWLSGLTCTDENFVTKAGAQRVAAELGLAILTPDTSPRGDAVADDAEGAWDFGLGAGFYVNATQSQFSKHYNMYDYIVNELPSVIQKEFPILADRQSISGHSMGGHGAMTIALKNPGMYQSVSTFSPICAPMQCAWGQKAFNGYFGEDRALWAQHDTVELLKTVTERLPMMVDQGDADNFLDEQLKPGLLMEACEEVSYPLRLRMQPGYDHSYYFIATFIADHLRFHAEALFS